MSEFIITGQQESESTEDHGLEDCYLLGCFAGEEVRYKLLQNREGFLLGVSSQEEGDEGYGILPKEEGAEIIRRALDSKISVDSTHFVGSQQQMVQAASNLRSACEEALCPDNLYFYYFTARRPEDGLNESIESGVLFVQEAFLGQEAAKAVNRSFEKDRLIENSKART
ncbi:MAG: hypothetical protein GY804_06235 [Alphaproteobacteria bacterium]|nr:hypothetical protein [Alphaproteobacteria bacterium]